MNSAGNVTGTAQVLLSAHEAQVQGGGSCFVEILSKYPTGWFVETEEAPASLADHLATVHTPGVLKDTLDL